jgi:hypothetical protein
MWIKKNEKLRFDVSRLDQWDIVFDHMSNKNVMLHVVFSEMENHSKLDKGLGKVRKLYYRELVARLGNQLGVTWNIGEEFTMGSDKANEFGEYVKSLDPFNNVVVLHTGPKAKNKIYTPLLGKNGIDGASLQVEDHEGNYGVVSKWVKESDEAGHAWYVCHDESGPVGKYGKPDSEDPKHDYERKNFLWGTLMAQGGGFEWILFGAKSNLSLEDFRTRKKLWSYGRFALNFFENVKLEDMKINNELVSGGDGAKALENSNEIVVYFPKGAKSAKLQLPSGDFTFEWFDPRKGGELQKGSVTQASGGRSVSVGNPPSSADLDWTLLVKRKS